MTAAEQQQEELEVLRSIFDGDLAFSVIGDNSIQYRFGTDGDFRSFLLEIRWPIAYPDDEIPEFVLDLFYNKHLTAETKWIVLQCLKDEANILRGSPMTYSMIELVKDRFEQLMLNQVPRTVDENTGQVDTSDAESTDDISNRKQVQGKTEKLTKAQKRKMWDRGQANDEKPRGWNWVDVVKHLSQTGNAT